jgi:hypothetical protein
LKPPKPAPPPKPSASGSAAPALPPKPAKPALPPKPIKNFTAEEQMALLQALKKCSGANKQLSSISLQTHTKSEELVSTRSDIAIMRKQLMAARESLLEANEKLTQDLRAAVGTDDQDVVRSLLRDSSLAANYTAALVSLSRNLTLELTDEPLLKNMITATTTALASMTTLSDLLSQATGTVDEDGSTLQQLASSTKTVDAALMALVSSTTEGALITEGKRLEMQATANAVVRALVKLTSSFTGAIQQSIVTEAKVCSCCISSFCTLLEDAAASHAFLRKTSARQCLIDCAASLKQVYTHFMDQTKLEVSNANADSAAHMITVVEPVIAKVRQCMAAVIAISKIDSSSTADEMPVPAAADITQAEKVTNVPMKTATSATTDESMFQRVLCWWFCFSLKYC